MVQSFASSGGIYFAARMGKELKSGGVHRVLTISVEVLAAHQRICA
jgi:hypothetical protein